MSPAMMADLVRGADGWALSVAGVVDIARVREIHERALEAATAPAALALRLDGLEAFDAALVQVMLALQRACAARGVRVSVAGVPTALLDLWHLAGLGEALG